MQMLTDPADTRPIILVEYLYQICNSGGGMYKFAELLEKYSRFQGGYIWDWQDKSLIAKTPAGEELLITGLPTMSMNLSAVQKASCISTQPTAALAVIWAGALS